MTAPALSRRWWEFGPDRNLHCCAGHSIPNTFRVAESGFVRCNKWDSRLKAECGKWVFVYIFRGGSAIAADISLQEQRAMEAMSSPAEMLVYLKLFLPPRSLPDR